MDMNTGIVHELDDEEIGKIKIQNLKKATDRHMMKMTKEEVQAVKGMPNRRARRYMMKRPCDCGSGRQARKCCFKHL